jgi:phosphatidate cytidylyltransferase
MLKYRLIFGLLMTVVFVGLMLADGWLDGSLSPSLPYSPIQGTILCVLVALLAFPSVGELATLAKVKELLIFVPIATAASILVATSPYVRQFVNGPPELYLALILVFALFALLIYQARWHGTSGVIGNCGASFFAIIYFGLLSSFLLAIRIDFGVWGLLTFVFVVKSSDIGAYTFGKLFGKHKFSPRISPGKTWEGMAGAVVFAAVVAFLFSAGCGIMTRPQAALFGVCFAFIGQLGDLAESLIKRDAERKDSAHSVPGFGGVLDVIDSPLAAAPLAYLYFMLVGAQ